jgi:hypothetical protein
MPNDRHDLNRSPVLAISNTALHAEQERHEIHAARGMNGTFNQHHFTPANLDQPIPHGISVPKIAGSDFNAESGYTRIANSRYKRARTGDDCRCIDLVDSCNSFCKLDTPAKEDLSP